MPRRSRLVIPGTPHHITQRGSRRGDVFFCDQDKRLYITLLKLYADRNGTLILGYCLMDNHVHLILVPHSQEGLSRTIGSTHMRYAQVINGKRAWTGHLWQERYFSSALDDNYLWTAMRYVERNPVAAGMVKHACDYQWSSAREHCKISEDLILTQDPKWLEIMAERRDWYGWLKDEESPALIKSLRDRTARDLPCGEDSYLMELEKTYGVRILPRKAGRPRTVQENRGQEVLSPI